MPVGRTRCCDSGYRLLWCAAPIEVAAGFAPSGLGTALNRFWTVRADLMVRRRQIRCELPNASAPPEYQANFLRTQAEEGHTPGKGMQARAAMWH